MSGVYFYCANTFRPSIHAKEITCIGICESKNGEKIILNAKVDDPIQGAVTWILASYAYGIIRTVFISLFGIVGDTLAVNAPFC